MDDLQFVVKFLCCFLDVFHAYIVKIRVLRTKAEGVIMYTDGESQEFVWYYTDVNRIKMTLQLLKLL